MKLASRAAAAAAIYAAVGAGPAAGAPGASYTLRGTMAIGCPTLAAWDDIFADSARQYTTVYSIADFARSHGCDLAMATPGLTWSLIETARGGRFLHLEAGAAPALFYRVDDFARAPDRP